MSPANGTDKEGSNGDEVSTGPTMKLQRPNVGWAMPRSRFPNRVEDSLEQCLSEGVAALERSADALKRIDAILAAHEGIAGTADGATPDRGERPARTAGPEARGRPVPDHQENAADGPSPSRPAMGRLGHR